MPVNGFLHGVEWIQANQAIAPANFPRSGVVGVIGTAPMHLVESEYQSVNTAELTTSYYEAAQKFGGVFSDVSAAGFTLPEVLEAIYQQTAAAVVVVNVWDKDDSSHYTETSAESVTITDGKATVANTTGGIYNVVVEDSGQSTTYVEDTDYTVDLLTGEITMIESGDITEGDTLAVTYRTPDLSAIADSDIIGTVDTDGTRTGMQAWEDAFSLFGFYPRILVAPGFSTAAGVAQQLKVEAERMLGIAGVDAPAGVSPDDAVAGRNDNTGDVSNFMHSSDRLVLLYPHALNVHGNLIGLSAYWAGVFAMTQAKYGYHWSPSNKEINGMIGLEYPVSSTYTTPNSDVQRLNEVGIVTVFGAKSGDTFGAGFRMWGNRSSWYPTNTQPTNFIAIRVVEDQLRIALERAMLQYVDRPINDVTIRFIIQTINGYIGRLKGRGILLGGRAIYDEADNPVSALAAGHLTIRIDQASSPPLERITLKARYNEQYLQLLGARVLSEAAIGAPLA
jgi:phage tail sheath protein FI